MAALTAVYGVLCFCGACAAVAWLLGLDASPLPVGAAGVALSAFSASSLRTLSSGALVALKGCCPSCGEDVFAFVSASAADGRATQACHVCSRQLRFEVNVAGAWAAAPWRRRAAGRVSLIVSEADYRPPKPLVTEGG